MTNKQVIHDCQQAGDEIYSVQAVTNSILRALRIPKSKQIVCETGCPHSAEDYVAALVGHACMEAAERTLILWERRKANQGGT